jgi:hypothetical protein
MLLSHLVLRAGYGVSSASAVRHAAIRLHMFGSAGRVQTWHDHWGAYKSRSWHWLRCRDDLLRLHVHAVAHDVDAPVAPAHKACISCLRNRLITVL